mmetsp:Transcript_15544/g.35831  ORF Transcript_15544/g.35831 Transcript_15544/m.35831 type:complete len:103 (+) Transcript_15544:572-880(+)
MVESWQPSSSIGELAALLKRDSQRMSYDRSQLSWVGVGYKPVLFNFENTTKVLCSRDVHYQVETQYKSGDVSRWITAWCWRSRCSTELILPYFLPRDLDYGE